MKKTSAFVVLISFLFFIFLNITFAQVPQVGLLVELQFEEGFGTQATDHSGNGNNGTLENGPAWTAGKLGGGIDLDGADDQIVIANKPSLSINGTAITLAAWIFPHNGGVSGGSRIISKRTDGGGSDVYAMYTQNNRLRFRIDGKDLESSNTFTTNQWIHVVMVYNGVDKRIYLNGVLDPASPQGKTDFIDTSSRAVHIGTREGEGRRFDGVVDEIYIYNPALSASEVQALFNAGQIDTTPPLRSNGAPVGTLPFGTVSATLSLSTDEDADCRYGNTSGTGFDALTTSLTADSTGTSHSAVVSGLSDGSANNYYARCRDQAGNTNTDDYLIAFSIASAPDTTPPSVPTGLGATAASPTSVNLFWSASTDLESGIGHYNIYRDNVMVGMSSITGFSDSGLTPNTLYRYEVSAVNGVNLESGRSASVSVTTPGPGLGFTDITLSAGTSGPLGGHGVMFADVDQDHLADYYLTINLDSTGVKQDLFFGNAGGNIFVEEGTTRGIADLDGGSHGAVWADLDNDGDYDLVNGTTWNNAGTFGNPDYDNVYRNNGNGFFTDVTPLTMRSVLIETRGIIAFDMDKDGDLDIYGIPGTQMPGENEVFRNDGNFQFSVGGGGALSSATSTQGLTDTDFDGDGDIDVIAANRLGDFAILRNDGVGNFTLVSPSAIGIGHNAEDGITSADVDNDGDLDLLLASDNKAHLYLNNGARVFSYQQSFSGTNGYMGGFADLDHDGDLDLVFAGDDIAYLNTGNGAFVPGPAIPVAGTDDPRAVAFADIDNDGDLDFAFAAKRSRNWLIRNDFNAGNWLKVQLVSPQGQAGAFGAKTKIYPAGQAFAGPLLGMRESKSNHGYLGQDDPVLHFGLGLHTAVDLVVEFLDGSVVVQGNVGANQKVMVNAFNPDTTPPSPPAGLAVTGLFETQVDLAWTASEDAETGVSHYRVYRDGVNVGSSPSTSFSDTGLTSNTAYFYEVSAVNGFGLESAKSAPPVNAVTLQDNTPPIVVDINPSVTKVTIQFDEALDLGSASTVNHYLIDNGITVLNAVLNVDQKTVVLTTTLHAAGVLYTLSINNVSDSAGNAIVPVNLSYNVIVTDPNLVAYWAFEEGLGTEAADGSGNGNKGTLVNGPAWTAGKRGGGIDLDGVDDHIVIDNDPSLSVGGTAITLAAWIYPHNKGASGGSRVISKRTDGGGLDVYAMYTQSSRLRFRLDGEDMVSANTFTTNQWVHVVMVYDGVDKRIYLDGILDPASPQAKTDPIDTSSRAVHIGMREAEARRFDGIIDEVYIYNRALNASEVQALFNAGS